MHGAHDRRVAAALAAGLTALLLQRPTRREWRAWALAIEARQLNHLVCLSVSLFVL